MLFDEKIAAFIKDSVLPHHTCVVAVSGGADSMALLCLMQGLQEKYHFFKQIMAATVDHGLRVESHLEAAQVKMWCASLGINHVTLVWEGDKPKSGVQAKARQARYDLLTHHCKEKGAKYLMTAHHFDDQCETFFLRLLKGSGVQGLRGMRAIQNKKNITLLRPFLSITKKECLDYLEKISQAYLHDPSNDNLDFERVKMRQMLSDLSQKGLDTQAIGSTIHHCEEVSDFIERGAGPFIEKILKEKKLVMDDFSRLDVFLQKHILRQVAWALSQKDYPPRFRDVEAILHAIEHQENFTFAGYIWRFKGGIYTLIKEKRREKE